MLGLSQSQEIEKAVLSVALQYENQLDEIERIGGEEIFHLRPNLHLYRFIKNRRNEGVSNELIQLTKSLEDDGLLKQIGGPSGLAEIYSYATTKQHLESHIEILLKLSNLRKAQKLGLELSKLAGGSDLDDVNESIESTLRDMASKRKEVANNTDLTREVIGDLQFALGGGDESGLELGFPEVEKKIGRFKENQLTIIAARPGSGKTSFMMNLIENISINEENPSLVFSLEMTAKQLAQRYIMGSAGVNYRDLANQKVVDGKRVIEREGLVKIRNSARKFKESKLKINDQSSIGLGQMIAEIRADVRERGTKIVFIDYLQIMKANDKIPRERAIAEISAGLKAVAKELEISIVVLCQLNRMSEGRTSGFPRVADLRESGSLESDADTVILLHRLITTATTTEERMEAGRKAYIIVGKCRHGETGNVAAKFLEEETRFIESYEG